MEGQMPQSLGFGRGQPFRIVRHDEDFQHRVPLLQHPQIVVLFGAVDLTEKPETQFIHVKFLRLLPA